MVHLSKQLQIGPDDGGPTVLSGDREPWPIQFGVLVIVNNLNVIGISAVPSEAEPPLIVDSHAMLALAISF